MAVRPSQSLKAPKKKRLKLSRVLVILAPLLVLGLGTGVTAMQLENHDNFCASCHSEPEATYFQRESAASVDLASFHTAKDTRCIDCHSGAGLVPGRVSALMLGARDLFMWVTGHAVQPAVYTRLIDDASCLKCHADVANRRSFNNHFHVFLSRWQAVDQKAATCVTCHQAHHTDVETQLQFLNRANTTEVCQNCHRILGERG